MSPSEDSPMLENVPAVTPGHPVSCQDSLRNRTSQSSSPASAQRLFDSLKKEIVETNGPSYLERADIPPEIGYILAVSLSQDDEVESRRVGISYNPTTETFSVKMPSHTHASIGKWASTEWGRAWSTGFWSFLGIAEVSGMAGLYSFRAPWQNAYLEPDFVFVYSAYGTRDLPTVVFEVGYGQSWSSQVQKKNLWLEAAPSVNVVVLIKWDERNNRTVAGYLELFRRGSPPTRMQIFPAPEPGTALQTLTFYRQDFYPHGTALPAGRNTTDLWHWDLDISA